MRCLASPLAILSWSIQATDVPAESHFSLYNTEQHVIRTPSHFHSETADMEDQMLCSDASTASSG